MQPHTSASPSPSFSAHQDPSLSCKRAAAADELLDYVAFLENELESLKLHSHALQSKHQEDKSKLKERLEVTLDKMDQAQRELQAQKVSGAQTQTAVERLKEEFRHTECLLQEERRREKSLEDRIQKLELELEMKNDLINHRRKRDERARRQLEKENEILKKKATLGWMLGCLSEVYLQSEPEGAAAPLLKMVRNIQRELERENVVLSYCNEPPQMHLEYVEKEIRRLIDCARLADSEAEPSIGKSSDPTQLVKQSAPSTQRSLLEEGDSAGGFSAKSMVSDSEDTQKVKFANAVACRPQGSRSPNLRVHEEGGSPSARYIINCFGGEVTRNNTEIGSRGTAVDNDDDDELDTVGEQAGWCNANNYCTSQAQIEMFEANPEVDVEHTRLSGSTWAELKVMNKREAEAAEMLHCQADIKRMLSRLEASMQYLLQHQQPQQVLDRGIDNLDNMILSTEARKNKSKAGKLAGMHRSIKHPGTAGKDKAPATITKHKVTAASPKLKAKKQH